MRARQSRSWYIIMVLGFVLALTGERQDAVWPLVFGMLIVLVGAIMVSITSRNP